VKAEFQSNSKKVCLNICHKKVKKMSKLNFDNHQEKVGESGGIT
jgi:hypothetical protein